MRDSLERSHTRVHVYTGADIRLKEVRICVGVCINVGPRGESTWQ